MTARVRLPQRRPAETREFEFASLRYTTTIGRGPDGRIAEIFLNNHRTNSAADVAARDSGIGSASGIVGAVLDLIGEECMQ